MTKYRIKPGKQAPPSTDVSAKHKDFSQLQSRYKRTLERIHKRPLYRDPKMLFALALVLLVAWLLYIDAQEQKEKETPKSPPAIESTK